MPAPPNLLSRSASQAYRARPWRRRCNLCPSFARLIRFSDTFEEIGLGVNTLPIPALMKLGQFSATPLRKCTPLLGHFVECRRRAPLRHGNAVANCGSLMGNRRGTGLHKQL